MSYHKQGRGTLTARATLDAPELAFEAGEAWVEMITEITDEKNEKVSTCKTKWQLKEWQKVRVKKS